MGYIQGSRSWDCFGAPKTILPRISESSVQVSAKWMWAPAAVRRVMHWATFSTRQYNLEMHYWKGRFLQQQWLMICSTFFPTKDSSSYKNVSKRVRNQFQMNIRLESLFSIRNLVSFHDACSIIFNETIWHYQSQADSCQDLPTSSTSNCTWWSLDSRATVRELAGILSGLAWSDV